MKINAFADVSLRAMMVLAAAPDGGLLTTQSIADAVGTPYNHVSKAMAKLRELGMIDVERGRNGGSRLSSAGRRRHRGPAPAAAGHPHGPGRLRRRRRRLPAHQRMPAPGALARAREAFYRELDDIVVASLPTSRQMAPVFQAIGLRPGL